MLFAMIALVGSSSASVSDEDCGACHEDIQEAYAETAHGIYLSKTVDSEYSCQVCHGPGQAHADNSDPDLILNPINLPVRKHASNATTDNILMSGSFPAIARQI